MTRYTISTDCETLTTEADNIATALAEFGTPDHVRDAGSFECWLSQHDGYGFIEADDVCIASVRPT